MLFRFFALAGVMILVCAGCGDASKTDTKKDQQEKSAHHHPAHGPNGGHLIQMEPGSGDFKIEWKKTGGNLITMYLLDSSEKPTALKVDSFQVTPLGGNDPQPFKLLPVKANDEGKASEFSLSDQSLFLATSAVGVKVEIKSADLTIVGKISPHMPLDH